MVEADAVKWKKIKQTWHNQNWESQIDGNRVIKGSETPLRNKSVFVAVMNMEFGGQSSGIRVSYRAESLELAGIYCVAQGHSRKMESSAHTPACQLPLSEIIRCQEAYTPASAKLKPLCYLWTCPQAVSFVLQVPRLYLSLTSPIITNHNIYIFFCDQFPQVL